MMVGPDIVSLEDGHAEAEVRDAARHAREQHGQSEHTEVAGRQEAGQDRRSPAKLKNCTPPRSKTLQAIPDLTSRLKFSRFIVSRASSASGRA